MNKIVWGLFLILISSNVTVGGFEPKSPLDILGLILLGISIKEIQATDKFKIQVMRGIRVVAMLLLISKAGLMFVDGGVYGWGLITVFGVANQVLNLIAILIGARLLSIASSIQQVVFLRKIIPWLVISHIVASVSIVMFLQAGQLYTDTALRKFFLNLTVITAISTLLIRVWAIIGLDDATKRIC